MRSFGAIAFLVPALISLSASCSRKATPSRMDDCPFPFQRPDWGLSACLHDSFVQRGDTVLFGPDTPWPFLDGHHRFEMRARPHRDRREQLDDLLRKEESTRLVDSGIVDVLRDRISDVRPFDVSGIPVIRYWSYPAYAQCGAVVFAVFGHATDYEITYPACGGIVNDEFHREAERYIHSAIQTFRFD
jgi:hypothetical protein